MSRLTELLDAVKNLDPKIGGELLREVHLLQQRTSYGLMFERHRPEAVELPGHPPRKGSKVRLLPPRGSREKGEDRQWKVQRVDAESVDLISAVDGELERRTVARDDVVVVAEFNDPIYPGLRVDETVECGGDKPFHTVISGENFHVLQQLTFTHAHAVDVIYIDPPYNTGAKDWKYNNDYVGEDDRYRHSKWLAFMERRLKFARRLLKPDDSVLIVTIDEKEYLRLGLLLEQTFPEARIQMVTSCIKPSGSQRTGEFSRVEEYIFFVMFGSAQPSAGRSDMLRDAESVQKPISVTWQGLRRRGSTDWRREARPNGFYPIFVHESDGSIHSVGEPIPLSVDRRSVVAPTGTWAAWPLDPEGREGRWQISPRRLREQLGEGTAALRSADRKKGSASIVYLKGGDLKALRNGEFAVEGRDAEGKLILRHAGAATRKAKTMWVVPSHDASTYGTALLSRFLPDRKFPFPKSLYAVEDALRFFVADKPDAVILDFFAGSGTTAHAVMRLNRQDGGRRHCILATNNEVSADEQAKLRKQGLRPGDPQWEQWGICDYITKPRVRAAITGKSPDGSPIKGDYKFVDVFPMAEGFEENAVFMSLTYESPWLVSNDRAFDRIARMLWLRAGARGEVIRDFSSGWAVTDAYGILADLDKAAVFVDAVRSRHQMRVVFIVTDDVGRFQQVVTQIPDVEHVRLYAEYLRNFEQTGDLA